MATEKPDDFEMEAEPDFEGPANRTANALERIETNLSEIRGYLSNWNSVFWGVIIVGAILLVKNALSK